MGQRLSLGEVYVFQQAPHQTLTLSATKIGRLQQAYHSRTRDSGELHPGDAIYQCLLQSQPDAASSFVPNNLSSASASSQQRCDFHHFVVTSTLDFVINHLQEPVRLQQYLRNVGKQHTKLTIGADLSPLWPQYEQSMCQVMADWPTSDKDRAAMRHIIAFVIYQIRIGYVAEMKQDCETKATGKQPVAGTTQCICQGLAPGQRHHTHCPLAANRKPSANTRHH